MADNDADSLSPDKGFDQMAVKVEICIDSYESVKGLCSVVGDDGYRIEVCSNLMSGGGLTPSLGLVTQSHNLLTYKSFMIMIRPRTGSFVYGRAEVDTMLHEIAAFKALGVRGVVFGCLTEDGEVDVSITRRLVTAAKPLEVTFHRAFDVTNDWRQAFDDIVSIEGIDRILTSGHAKTAFQGASELSQLIAYANDPKHPRKVVITPASGINADNVSHLRELLPLMEEVHLSCGRSVKEEDSDAIRRGVELGFGKGEVWRLDERRLSEFWRVLEGWK